MASAVHYHLGSPLLGHHRGRRVEWRVPAWAYDRFLELAQQVNDLPPGNPLITVLEDDIRSLPGFPRYYDPDRDLVVPVVTTERSR